MDEDSLERERERGILMQALPSLFLVEVSLKHLLKEEKKDGQPMYLKRTSDVKKAEFRNKPPADAVKVDQKHRLSTGFTIAQSGNTLRILTCAHTLSDVYTAEMDQLTIAQVKKMFRFDVLCSHQEQVVLATPNNLIPSLRQRCITPADVIALDTALDLLVLEFDSRDICLDSDATPCASEHPPIQLALLNPPKAHKIVLAGWPPQRSSAVAIGQVSHCDWTYDAVTSLNVKGYGMRLLEVHGMTGGNGFSGGPCLTTDCRCVGVYHGVFNETMGYAVSLQNVNSFLGANEILTRWDVDDEED